MTNFKATGVITQGDKISKFTKNVHGKDEAEARELIYCLVGGKEKLPRRYITINDIKEVSK
jgi:ribosomal protein L20A (L18A)